MAIETGWCAPEKKGDAFVVWVVLLVAFFVKEIGYKTKFESV
jgi:hypothetical protein